MDIMTGKNCRQLSLLTSNSLIGQFVHPVGGKRRWGKGDGRGESLS